MVFYLLITSDVPTELFHCYLFTVARGLRGGYEGVARGLRGVDLSDPPGKSQDSPDKYSIYIERMIP